MKFIQIFAGPIYGAECQVNELLGHNLARPLTKCVDFIGRCRPQLQRNFISGGKRTQPLKWPPRCPLNEKFLRPMNEKSVTFQSTVCRLVPADASADTGEAQPIPSASPRRIFGHFFRAQKTSRGQPAVKIIARISPNFVPVSCTQLTRIYFHRGQHRLIPGLTGHSMTAIISFIYYRMI